MYLLLIRLYLLRKQEFFSDKVIEYKFLSSIIFIRKYKNFVGN